MHVIPLGERHLRGVLREFVAHYHAERNHQGLANVIPFPPAIRSPPAAASDDVKDSVACSTSTAETLRESQRIARWNTTTGLFPCAATRDRGSRSVIFYVAPGNT